MMKFLIALWLLISVSAFGAVPAYTSFRGTGGILVTSNPPTGNITFDGSGIFTSSGTNATLAISTNGVLVMVAATNINFITGSNVFLAATNIGSRAHIGINAFTPVPFIEGAVTNLLLTWILPILVVDQLSVSNLLAAPPLSSVQYNSNGITRGSAGFIYTNGQVQVADVVIAGQGVEVTAGSLVLNGGDTALVAWNGLGRMRWPTGGVVRFEDEFGNLNRVQLGGDTAAFPAIGRTNGDVIILGGNGQFKLGGSTNRLIAPAVHIANDGAVGTTLLSLDNPLSAIRWNLAIDSNPETYFLGLGRVGDATYTMVWELGGNVGIGITNPTVRLDVQGRFMARSNVYFPNISSNATPVAFLATDSQGEVYETAVPTGGGGSATPAPPLSSVQFNSNGVMQGSASLAFTNGALFVYGELNSPQASDLTRTKLGAFAAANGAYSVALGRESVAATSGTATGPFATAGSGGAVASGYSAVASGSASIAIGGSSLAAAGNSIVIGFSATNAITETYNITIGNNASTTGAAVGGGESVTIGGLSTNAGYRGTAVGYKANIGNVSGTAIGRGARITSSHAIAVGRGAYGWDGGSVNIGFTGNTNGNNNVYFFNGSLHKFLDPIDSVTNDILPALTPTVIHGPDAYDEMNTVSNIAGGNLVLMAGRSTGTNAGGDLLFQVSPVGAVENNVKNATNTAMIITRESKVGIRTNAPDEIFHIHGPAVGDGAHLASAFVGTWDLNAMWAVFAHNSMKTGLQTYAVIQKNDGQTAINSVGNLTLNTTNTARITVAAGGNVGIGTNAPATRLQVTADNSVLNVLLVGTTNRPTLLTLTTNGGLALDNITASRIATWHSDKVLTNGATTVAMLDNFFAMGITNIVAADANIVIRTNAGSLTISNSAASGGAAISGHSNAIPFMNTAGNALTFIDSYNFGSLTNPGFGFIPRVGAAEGGLLVFANSPMGLVTIGHPNPGSDYATFATALVISNRYNGLGDFKNDMVKIDAVLVAGSTLQTNSTMMRWRVWQAPSGASTNASTSSNDVAELTIKGEMKLAGGIQVGTNGAMLTNTLYASATLNFPSTEAGTVSDLPITVVGAADGDIVALGEPSGSIGPLTGVYNAWASNDVVYVRFANNNLVTAQDPASGVFRVRVDKFQ